MSEINDEAALLDEIKNRDELERLLNAFAYAIAPIEEIGEHSSANDPWANALEIVEGKWAAAEARGRKQAADQVARRFESKAVASQIGHPEDRTVSSVWNEAAAIARAYAAEQDITGGDKP